MTGRAVGRRPASATRRIRRRMKTAGGPAGHFGREMMNQLWTWRILSESQIEQIRAAAVLHIERHGFGVQHEGLLARARQRGAQVDEAQGRVRMSRSLCAELMAQLPC